MLSAKSLWSMQQTYQSRRENTEYTQNPIGSVFSPESNNKARAKTTKTESDTGSVILTPDPTRPDPSQIVDLVTHLPVIRRPGSNTDS